MGNESEIEPASCVEQILINKMLKIYYYSEKTWPHLWPRINRKIYWVNNWNLEKKNQLRAGWFEMFYVGKW